MTPNIGQGANLAIENAAALANVLQELLSAKGSKKPSMTELEYALKAFNRRQFPRANLVYKEAANLSRLQAKDGAIVAFVGRYLLPHLKNLAANRASKLIAGAAAINYIDLPRRSGLGWEQFKPRQSRGPAARTFLMMAITIISLFLILGKDLESSPKIVGFL